MLAVLRQRNFALLWFGGLISFTGDAMLAIALPFYVYDVSGSMVATGLIFMSLSVPSILLGSVAGVFVDRWDRRRTMVTADILRAAILLPLLTVSSSGSLWTVVAVTLAGSAVSQFFAPAENSLLPSLVSEGDLVAANSLNTLNNNIARLSGAPLGGLLLAWLGLPGVVLVDALSFLVSALLIGLIRTPSVERRQTETSTAPRAAWLRFWSEWLEGLRLVREQRWLTTLFVVTGIVMLGNGIEVVLLVAFARDVLQAGSAGYGWLFTAYAVGGLVGGVIIAQVGRATRAKRLLGLAGLAWGLIFLVIINIPSFVLALALLLVMGVPGVGWRVGRQSLLQVGVPDRYRGRIFGALGATASLVLLTAEGIAAVLGETMGVVLMLNVAALLYISAGVTALLVLPDHVPRAEPAPDMKEASTH